MSAALNVDNAITDLIWNRSFIGLLRDTFDIAMTSTASTATPAKHEFERRVEEAKSPKSDINALILDYLTMEGYPNAAAKFSKEANLQPQQDGASIRTRQEIQNFIHGGNIQSAIETLNELDPQVSSSTSPPSP
ncbi:hypothetical protein CDD83_8952 [Cordyceps sp. RAO-2017]|nr:hypothetical protein CDD83_8952 [Cordyceps sp. RAO-2017]